MAGTDHGEHRRWHQALAFALTGQRWEQLGEQPQPDVNQLVDDLRSLIPAHGEDSPGSRDWPHLVPADLMAGLGYAQFVAVLAQVHRQLGLDPSPGGVAQPKALQRLTAGERRLLDEVPPHHGS
ncbi:MAG: hypothetical protein H0T91_11955 [Propionibacteriaceae bacterium]|nr:hypothetical protein [Propionibacteriaceae bacterium]